MAEAFDNVSPYNYGMNNPILMIDPTGMAADSVAGSIVGPIIEVWRKGTGPFAGVLTKPKVLDLPKFRLPGPPNPFILIAGLFLLPSNYFDPKRSPDEMEWYRNNRHLLAKKHKLGDQLPTPELNKEKFNKKRGNQGWENKETGEIYQKSHTAHGNKNNEGTQWKVWPKGTTDFGSNSKKSGERTTLDQNGIVIGN